MEGNDDLTWTCRKCTFINDAEEGIGDDEPEKCLMCQESRRFSMSSDGSLGLGDRDAEVAAIRGELIAACDNKGIRLTDVSTTPRFTTRTTHTKEYDGDGDDRDHTPKTAPVTPKREDSTAARRNMSFAAWKSERLSWKCKACTFVNEPNHLMCGACGMAEGSAGVEDEIKGLSRLSLRSAQNFLVNAVHKQLDSDREEQLMHDRAVELLKEEIKEKHASKFSGGQLTAMDIARSAEDDRRNKRRRTSVEKAREHLETLERIQQAERDEHEEMAFTIAQWRLELMSEPNDKQEKEMHKQEEQLKHFKNEWNAREEELRQLRMRLEGNLASI